MVSGLFSSARPATVKTIVKTAACNNDCKLIIFMKGPRYISRHVGSAHHNPMGVSIVTTTENGLNCYVEPARRIHNGKFESRRRELDGLRIAIRCHRKRSVVY